MQPSPHRVQGPFCFIVLVLCWRFEQVGGGVGLEPHVTADSSPSLNFHSEVVIGSACNPGYLSSNLSCVIQVHDE